MTATRTADTPILTGSPWAGFPCAEANGLPRLRYNPYALSPKQTAYLLYPGDEALFGGSGGSGKSIGLLAAALMFVDVPGYNAALFRRSLTDFTLPDGLIDVSHDWLDGTDAQWNGNKYRWTFPSGAVLQFAYLRQWGAERRYKSTQFQFVGFDEVTEFPWEEQMIYLFSRMRTGVSSAEEAAAVYGTAPDGLTLYDVPLRMRGATNPGGPGHAWVYKRYVDKENPNRQPFLPATLDDNPGINKEEYRRMLAKLPEVERQRMEEGNWDVIEVPGALWRFADYQHVDQKWVPPASDVGMRVLSIDPSITAEGDECGMIMGSITGGIVTVELDLSKQMHPDVWARLAIETMVEYGVDRVVCEDNQGGELVFSALRNAAEAMGVPYPRIIKVHSSISKEARAVPVAQAYRAGKVRHSVLLRSGPLESQQTSWVPGISKESPDRIDADVWLVRHALFGEGTDVEYHNSSARQQLSARNQTTGAPVTHSTAASALRKGSSRGPGRL